MVGAGARKGGSSAGWWRRVSRDGSDGGAIALFQPCQPLHSHEHVSRALDGLGGAIAEWVVCSPVVGREQSGYVGEEGRRRGTKRQDQVRKGEDEDEDEEEEGRPLGKVKVVQQT